MGAVLCALPTLVDVGTEYMRFMDEVRLTAGSHGHIISKRVYKVRIKIQGNHAVHSEADEEVARPQADIVTVRRAVGSGHLSYEWCHTKICGESRWFSYKSTRVNCTGRRKDSSLRPQSHLCKQNERLESS